MMRKVFRRLLYSTPGEFHNPLMFPFLLVTGVLGVSFVFFPESTPVQASVLYELTLAHLPDGAISVWGVLAMLLILGVAHGMMARKKWIGDSTTWVGVLLWIYATLLYALYGYWLQVLSSGLPNLVFWIWYWFYVRDYHNNDRQAP